MYFYSESISYNFFFERDGCYLLFLYYIFFCSEDVRNNIYCERLYIYIYIYIYIYKKDAYILFKDHKPNFENKLQSRLINPSKTELGKVLKNIIQNIVTNVKKAYHSNLWRNSYDTIEWFRKIRNKSKATFMQFDIIDFYPSITKNTLIDKH